MTSYPIHPAAECFPLLDNKRLDELVADIRAQGQISPIVLWNDGEKDWLLDGRNRLRACEAAGVDPRVERWCGDDPWDYVWSLNAERRDLEPGQRACIRLKVVAGRADWRKACEERKANKAHSRKCTVALSTPPAKESVATEARVSPRTAQKALTVQKEAPVLFEQAAAGKVKLNQAYRQIQRERAVSKIQSEPAPLLTGPYRVIVADPPWAYEKRKDDGSHRAALSYPDMTTDEICAYEPGGQPVDQLGEEDSILWLWTTNAFMRDAFRVLDAWGYREKTILTWAKDKMGTGDWLRGQTEHCILAVRGKPVVNLTNQTTLLRGPVREHSRKPDEFYAMVRNLCPGSRLELFGREQREGFVVYGVEADKFDAH